SPMMVGIAVETTVASNDASAVTSTSAVVTARRRPGSNRGESGVDMERRGYRRESKPVLQSRQRSSERASARRRRNERFFLQGMEGELLSRGPPGLRHAAVLRGQLPLRRDQQHVLPDASRPDAGAVGRASPG